MKKIIVPMDFTKASTNALQYALDLYSNKAEFTIVHVASGLLDLSEKPSVYLLENAIDTQQRQMTDLVNETLGVDTLPNNMEVIVLVGSIVLEISRYVEEAGDFDAMVLATKDKYDFIEKWFGTISLGLVKKVDIPVYLIPIYAEFKGYQKIVLASDAKLDNKNTIANINKWNNLHQADIKYLYVHSDKVDYTDMGEFELDQDNFGLGIDVEVIHDIDVSEALLARAYNQQADLMVALPEHHSFIYTMLFKSISKELILKSDIPILFFPKDYEYTIEASHQEWTAKRL